MKIRHIRDENRNPVATLVELDGHYGLAVPNRGVPFNKKRAVEIAYGRALKGSNVKAPNKKIKTSFGRFRLADLVRAEIESINDSLYGEVQKTPRRSAVVLN